MGTLRHMVNGYLYEFMWRQRHMNEDLFSVMNGDLFSVMNEDLFSVILNSIDNYDSNNENIAP